MIPLRRWTLAVTLSSRLGCASTVDGVALAPDGGLYVPERILQLTPPTTPPATLADTAAWVLAVRSSNRARRSCRA